MFYFAGNVFVNHVCILPKLDLSTLLRVSRDVPGFLDVDKDFLMWLFWSLLKVKGGLDFARLRAPCFFLKVSGLSWILVKGSQDLA